VQVVAITPGRSAMIVVDGRAPRTIRIGETVNGVTLVRTHQRSAVLDVDGVTKTLPLVANPSGGSAGADDSVTIVANAHGHFTTRGSVNGRSVDFMVDTGATSIAFSRATADRIGVTYERRKPGVAMTAGGPVLAYPASLATVRVGDLTAHNVEAVVVESQDFGVALLGMSFLRHFEMHRQGSKLVLRRDR
jgi:aspartyl protease family protein